MSYNWLIIVNWAVIMNTLTKKKRLVVVVNWVCFATFHNWWKEGRVRLKGYVKGRYYRKVGAASADDVDVAVEVTFLSLHLAVSKSNQAPHAIDATLRLRLLDGVEILRHRSDLSHCLISTQVRERHQRDPAARLSRLTGEVGADAPRSPGGGARRPDGARLHHRGRVRHPVLGPARVVRCGVVLRRLLVVDLNVPGLPRCVVRARRTNQPSRRPRCLRAIDARRLHLLMKWVVYFSILRPFGPTRCVVGASGVLVGHTRTVSTRSP